MKYLCVVAASMLCTGCVVGDFGPSDRYQTDFHYSYDVSANPRLNVESLNGSVEIAGWDEKKVDVSGTKYGATEQLRDSVQIEVRNSPDSVDVRTVTPSSRMGSRGVRYKIRVPRQARLDRITTSNGRIEVRDVAEAAHLKSSNGSIRAEKIAGDLEARTSNSSIEVDGIAGNAVLRSSNGHIHGEDVGGECSAETSNSSIRIRLQGSPQAPTRLKTNNGSIELTMDTPPRSDIRAETHNGSITVRLPASTGARVNAETNNGSVSSDFEVRMDGENRKNHLDGTIGSGGPRVELSSSRGRIRIARGSGN